MYDVLIIGAGPAGAVAATHLARSGREVALIERTTAARRRGIDAWINVRVAELLEGIDLKPKALLGRPFSTVTFYDRELGKSAQPKDSGALGHLIETGPFNAALVEAAEQAGAKVQRPWQVADVRLRENEVELSTPDGATLSGRVLVAAMGPNSPLTERVLPSAPQAGCWTARVEHELGSGASCQPGVAVVLGLDRQGGFGLVLATEARVAISVSVRDEPQQVVGQLAALCGRLAEKGVVPVDLSKSASSAKARLTPAGAALDMDTHVAKHSMVIGEAGGFIAASSDEGIYPAMWSAQLAADVAHRALDNRHSQDVLMEFDAQWRMAMAEYLRPPNTDTQFLIPLIFSNQPMADRMAAAFFNGENI